MDFDVVKKSIAYMRILLDSGDIKNTGKAGTLS